MCACCSSFCVCSCLSCECGLCAVLFEIRIVKYLSRRLFLSQENAKCFFWESSQEYMNCDRTPVKTPSASRRKIKPRTPQQSSQSSIEAAQWQTEVDDHESGSYEKEFEGEHRWIVRENTVIARVEQYLNESDNMKVEIDESLLGPEDSEVDLTCFLLNARRKHGRRIFQIFDPQGAMEGRKCRALDVVGKTTRRIVPRAQESHQIHE